VPGGRAHLDLGAHVDREHRADLRLRRHHVDRQIVHQPAVDVQVLAHAHGRQHAGQRDARADRAHERAALVHRLPGAREVGRHAQIGKREVLDRALPEHALELRADPPAGEERDDRQRRILELGEVLPALRERLGGRAPLRDEGGDDRTDARPAHPVDRDALLGKRAQDAEVRETARTAAAEHEADARPGQAAREPLEVFRAAQVDVVVAVDLACGDRRRRTRCRRRPGGAEENEAPPRRAAAAPALEERPLGRAGFGRRRGPENEHHVIGLADRPLGPARERRLGLVQHEVVRELLLVQPLQEPGARRIVRPEPRGLVAPERAIDAPRVEVQRAPAPLERSGEPAHELFRAGVCIRGHDRERPHRGSRGPRGRALPPQPLPQERADALQHERLALDQAVERGRRQPREQRVAHGEDGGRARLRRKERHLADDLAGTGLVQRPLAGRVVDDAQASAQHRVGRVAGIAAAEQDLPAAERDPLGVGLQLGEDLGRRGVE